MGRHYQHRVFLCLLDTSCYPGFVRREKGKEQRKMSVSCLLIPLAFHSIHSRLRTEKKMLPLVFLYPDHLLIKINLDYSVSPDLGLSVSAMKKLVRVFKADNCVTYKI